jgi:tetratricopeptide (TPR) repeat protein
MAYLEKPEPEGSDRGREEKRRWIVTPAPGETATEIEGISLLEELPREVAAPVFQWLRDALLWAQVEPAARPGLFGLPDVPSQAPGWIELTATPDLLRPARAAFMLLSVEPSSITPPALGTACAAVAEWANRAGLVKTELAFARATARADTASSDLAFRAGRAARRNSRYEEAQEWFRRAVGLARRADDDAAYTAAYLGWGVLEQARGNPQRARRRFVRAWRRAKGGRLPKLAAAARHYLIPLAVGNMAEGVRHAIAAYKLYGPDDHRLAALASDTGAFLSDHGHYSSSRPLFEAALPLIGASPDRLVPLSNLARAVAALGDRQSFMELWLEANQRGEGHGETLPDALIELAEGARTLRLFRKAEATLQEAISVASDRREPAALRRAETVLAELHSKPPDKDVPASPDIRRFVRRFVQRLRKQAASGP